MKKDFSKWVRWADRSTLDDLSYPGIYALAVSVKDISNESFEWRKEIVYIGMTNSIGGLKSRLNQFDNTIKGKEGHGGARRFRYKFSEYSALTKRLFVSIKPFICDVKSGSPKDLRIMGSIAQYEYECFACYVEKFGRLPEFNDKKRSPKK